MDVSLANFNGLSMVTVLSFVLVSGIFEFVSIIEKGVTVRGVEETSVLLLRKFLDNGVLRSVSSCVLISI